MAEPEDPDLPELATDDGTASAGREPIRRCLATGERRPREALIRFVLGPDGVLVPDLAAKLPGRGMWLSADPRSIKTALDRKLFARAARAAVTAPPDLADRVADLLARRCIETVSLARRAGEAVCGFEKTRAALKGDPGAAVLLQASDGAEDGRAKLAALAGGAVPGVAVLNAAELGEAFGRDMAVHAALAPGGLSRRFLTEAARLTGFRETAAGMGRPVGKDDG
ncbi:MAG: RNA-binding protein [Alphaproteobacteria bacterium]|nr:RNA-binding protein [Alphaproteobacteria bacterium]